MCGLSGTVHYQHHVLWKNGLNEFGVTLRMGVRIFCSHDTFGQKRATSYLFQSIGIATQRGNAASIAGTVPSCKGLDEIYYL